MISLGEMILNIDIFKHFQTISFYLGQHRQRAVSSMDIAVALNPRVLLGFEWLQNYTSQARLLQKRSLSLAQ